MSRLCESFGVSRKTAYEWIKRYAEGGVRERVLKRQLKVPRTDVSADFLEHSITLSDLLVALVDPASRPCAHCRRFALA